MEEDIEKVYDGLEAFAVALATIGTVLSFVLLALMLN